MMPLFPSITVVGGGLMGGSFIEAVKRTYPTTTFTVVDPNPIDDDHAWFAPCDLEQAVGDADLVFLAAPVTCIIEMLPRLANCVKKTALVTDAGSTKVAICRAAESLSNKAHFIGGHPMTGSHKQGYRHRDPTLFENCTYLVMPANQCSPEIHNRFIDFIHAIGALTYLIKARAHDIVVANVSHLPQLIATSLMNETAKMNHRQTDIFHLAGSGLKDMTRLAASDFVMWRDILATNAKQIIDAVDYFADSLRVLSTCLKEVDQSSRSTSSGPSMEILEKEFKNAGVARQALLENKVKHFRPLHYVHLAMADQAGVLAQVTNRIFDAGINIRSCVTESNRDAESGTTILGFETAACAEAVLALLSKQGYEGRIWTESQ